MTPTIGRIVLYRLSDLDVGDIAQRRHASRLRHGNPPWAGQELPLIVCVVWPDEFGPGVPGVNGQVMLDGTDTLWVTSVAEGDGDGFWHWP